MLRPSRLLLVLFAFSVTVPSASCSRTVSDPVAFQLYSGNESLPPPAQDVLIIDGRISAEAVELEILTSDGQNKSRRGATLHGEERQRVLEMVRRTRVTRPEFSEGSEAFHVTLTGARGKRVMGDPTNPEEWQAFAKAVQ
jgi:hypothetical protein